VGENTFVVPLQNGVEAPTRLAAVLGREHVLGGLCAVMTYVAAPGHICHAGIEPVIQFGELDNRKSPRVEALERTFANAQGLRAIVPADIEAAMWQKFLFIAGWGAVGAVTRAPAGVLRERAETRQLIIQAVKEIYDVARARNVSLGPEIIDKTMQTVDALPDGGTASMQRDIMGGRPSELDTQTGAVVRLGREAGVETPINTVIYAALLPLELRARGEVQFEA
jgi:2-dehydropantoate 2-reductase